MTPQHTGNRPETSVDDRTRLLAPVGRDDDATLILRRFGEPEPWPTSPVHDELLLAPRDVAGRDGGQKLAGEAFDLAEQRQAARHAEQRAEMGQERAPCLLTVSIGMLLAAVEFVVAFALGAWWG